MLCSMAWGAFAGDPRPPLGGLDSTLASDVDARPDDPDDERDDRHDEHSLEHPGTVPSDVTSTIVHRRSVERSTSTIVARRAVRPRAAFRWVLGSNGDMAQESADPLLQPFNSATSKYPTGSFHGAADAVTGD